MIARQSAARLATPADVDAIADTLTTAFFHDPLWGPAFPDADHRAEQAVAMWRLYAASALRHSWLLVTQNVEAAAVWIPPGKDELTPAEETDLHNLLTRTAGHEVARTIREIAEQCSTVRPVEPHFYLTLLGTHDQHRGRGLGMSLLADCLQRIDAEGAPAYLESTNPANLKRYESVGFTARDCFSTFSGHVVTTMWRSPQSAP